MRYKNHEISTVSGIEIWRRIGIGRHRGGRPSALVYAHSWRAAEGEFESLALSFDAFATPFDASSTRDAFALSLSIEILSWRFSSRKAFSAGAAG